MAIGSLLGRAGLKINCRLKSDTTKTRPREGETERMTDRQTDRQRQRRTYRQRENQR